MKNRNANQSSFNFMVRPLLFCVVLIFVTTTQSWAELSRNQLESYIPNALTSYAEKMLSHQKDLNDLMRYDNNNFDYALSIYHVATESHAEMRNIRGLLYMYSLVDGFASREHGWDLIEISFQNTLKLIDLWIESINLNISHASSDAIVFIGSQMKSELREVKNLLKENP